MIAALLRAQLLTMRLGRARGTGLGILIGVVWYGFWALAAVAVGDLLSDADPAALGHYLSLGLLGVCAYWQIIPALSASMGGSLDMRKLLVYPVPHRKLFIVEILVRLLAGIEMLMVLAGGFAGLLANGDAGGWSALPRFVAALALFIAFNVLTASGSRSILERLLMRRRVREVVFLLLAMLFVLPRVLIATGFRFQSVLEFGSALELFAYPWTAAARLALGDRMALAFAGIIGWTLLALWFGRTQFERSLRYDTLAAQATPTHAEVPQVRGWAERFYRMPSALWRDPLAAIVEKELRSLARSPRFRMVFIMGFTFGLMVWFPLVATRRDAAPSPYFLVIVCVYALTLLGQVTYWNAFGFDRSATAFYFIAPQPIARVLLGKNVAALCFIYVQVLIVIVVTFAFRLARGWTQAVEALLVIGICSLYTMALGNISSVRYPHGLTPERVSRGGASGRFQGLMFIVYPFVLFPVFLAYLARYAFDSDKAFAAVLSAAAIIGAAVYRLGLESAAATARARREAIVQELTKGEGPITAE